MTHEEQATADTPLAFDSSEQRVFLHLWRTYDLLRTVEDSVLARHGVSAQQYNALRLLKAAHPGGMQTMLLGQRMISRGPDMTRMLDRLEQRELITRRRSEENRRVVEARIAPEGLHLLDAMAEDILEMHKQQVGHLSASAQQQLIRLLQAVRKPHEDSSCGWLG